MPRRRLLPDLRRPGRMLPGCGMLPGRADLLCPRGMLPPGVLPGRPDLLRPGRAGMLCSPGVLPVERVLPGRADLLRPRGVLPGRTGLLRPVGLLRQRLHLVALRPEEEGLPEPPLRHVQEGWPRLRPRQLLLRRELLPRAQLLCPGLRAGLLCPERLPLRERRDRIVSA